MNKSLIIVAVILLIGLVGFFVWKTQVQQQTTEIQTPSIQKTSDLEQSTPSVQFSTPKKSAHYETNTPAHGTTLAGVPLNVVIDFNFDLASPSKIEIHYYGSLGMIGSNEWGVGDTVIDSNKLSMRRQMNPEAPDGKYSAAYTACWPDGSCHDGYFQFAIDRKQANNFTDKTDNNEVTVNLSDIMFQPQNIKIKKGTKVTWVNDDNVEHYVNTDSHPAHTYFLNQNSKAIKKGGAYSVAFDTPGIYPYHCSAHAGSMTGNILVE